MKNVNQNAKIILIVGCQRSGTSLTASMLGRHPEINMLFESQGKDVLKLIGKEYNGNKLSAWRHIRINQRASKFGHLVNRLANFDFSIKNKEHSAKTYPTSALSIDDYLKFDTKLITLRRDKENTVKSILNRTILSQRQAEKEWEQSNKILDYCDKNGSFSIAFDELISQPEEIMKNICKFLKLDFDKKMLEGSKYNYIYPREKIGK